MTSTGHPEPPDTLLGVHVAGWPAVVVDVLLRRYGGPYLKAMSSEQRCKVEAFHRSVHAAALYARAHASVTDVPKRSEPETASLSTGDEVSTAQAATLLGVSDRRVCQLASTWQYDGLARKVGPHLAPRARSRPHLRRTDMTDSEAKARRELEQHQIRLAREVEQVPPLRASAPCA